jgi:hypothetical protein
MIRALLFCAVLLLAGCGDVAPTQTPIPVPTATPAPTATAAPVVTATSSISHDPTQLIFMALTKKGFHAADYSISGDTNENTFSLVITNATGANLRAFTGTLHFQDLFGRDVKQAGFTYSELVPVNASIPWDGGLKFNPYMSEDVALRAAKMGDLHLVFAIEQYIDTSGAKQDFSK